MFYFLQIFTKKNWLKASFLARKNLEKQDKKYNQTKNLKLIWLKRSIKKLFQNNVGISNLG